MFTLIMDSYTTLFNCTKTWVCFLKHPHGKLSMSLIGLDLLVKPLEENHKITLKHGMEVMFSKHCWTKDINTGSMTVKGHCKQKFLLCFLQLTYFLASKINQKWVSWWPLKPSACEFIQESACSVSRKAPDSFWVFFGTSIYANFAGHCLTTMKDSSFQI